MPESNKPFVITDRRKFTKEGELRPGSEHTPQEPRPAAAPAPEPPAPAVPQNTAPQTLFQTANPTPAVDTAEDAEEDSIPAPTAEQNERSRIAYEQTADRIDTAMRAADPGGDHQPPMNFDGLVQSFYLTAIMQLGGTTREGEKPRVDILGARQSIDMLAVIAEKTRGNLNEVETKLLDSALFELRMAFLEVTQALARSAAAQGPGPRPGTPPKPGLVY